MNSGELYVEVRVCALQAGEDAALYEACGDATIPSETEAMPVDTVPVALPEDNITGIVPRLANVTDVSGGGCEGGPHRKPAFALKLEQRTDGCGEALTLHACDAACGGSTTTATPGAAAQQGGGSLPFKQENKLFLGGLAWETNEDGLRSYFGAFGAVLECMVRLESAAPTNSHPSGL